MSGPTQAAILRRWRAGYRLQMIARELGVTKYQVAAVLVERGVAWIAIEGRERGQT